MAIDPRHVGRRYGPFRSTVCADRIRDFAVAVAGGVPGHFGATDGEPHPWSVDEEAAARSPYGALVRPGDVLVTTGEVVEVRTKGALEFMTVRSETRNQSGAVVLVGRWTAVVRG